MRARSTSCRGASTGAYALGVRQARRELWRADAGHGDRGRRGRDGRARPSALRAALADGPRTVKELGDLATGFVGTHRAVGRPRARAAVGHVGAPPGRPARAGRGLGRPAPTPPRPRGSRISSGPTCARSVRRPGATSRRGPASRSPTAKAARRRASTLRAYRDEDGRQLVDLPEASRCPIADTPAPVRFLPHWDANLLVHARRTGLLPEAFRPRVFSTKNPFSVGTYLVDGSVAGAWSLRDGRIVLDPFVETATQRARVEREREALEAFHA